MPRLWEEIFKIEKEKLLSSRLRKGDKYSTINDLAEEHNVSTATSRRVIKELSDEELIVSIPKAGSIINRNLGPKKVYFLAYGSGVIHTEQLLGVSRIAVENNVEVINVEESFLYEKAEEDSVMLVFYDSILENCRELVKRSPHKLVFIAPFNIPGAWVVRHNSEGGSKMAINHLVERGHKRIAYLAGHGTWWAMGRFEGYLQALKENGIPFFLDYIKECKSVDDEGEESYSEVRRRSIDTIMCEWMAMKKRPTAVFCYSDEFAIYLMEYCRQNNIRVPEDLAVCGYNNHNFVNVHNLPEPTSVEDYWQTVGERAMEVAGALIDGDEVPPVTLVEGQLIEKSTT